MSQTTGGPKLRPTNDADLLHLQLVVQDVLNRHCHRTDHSAADGRPLQADGRGAGLHSCQHAGAAVHHELGRGRRWWCLVTVCLAGRRGRRCRRGRRWRSRRNCCCCWRQSSNARLPGPGPHILGGHHGRARPRRPGGGRSAWGGTLLGACQRLLRCAPLLPQLGSGQGGLNERPGLLPRCRAPCELCPLGC